MPHKTTELIQKDIKLDSATKILNLAVPVLKLTVLDVADYESLICI